MWFKKNNNDTPISNQYFTEEWMNNWFNSINTSEKYKRAGKHWNSPILLKFDPIPEVLKEQSAIGFFLDLKYGSCLNIKFATKLDEQLSDTVLTADEMTWIKLIEEKKDPTMMIMKKKLSLEKGSIVLLSTQRQAAKSLLETAPVFSDSKQQKEFIQEIHQKQEKASKHESFTTIKRGLDFESFPMKLFQKAKQYGIWDPSDIDLSIDKEHWQNLKEDEKEILIHLSGMFLAGEEAVTVDLLPLIQVIANEGRLEEEIFLTSFLWEEAKHTEFFSLFVRDVIGYQPDFQQYHGTHYKTLFYEKLPSDLNRLKLDDSPIAQLKASGTYNMIVEGTLAETGYAAYHKMLTDNDLMPGMQEGIIKLKQDESRHIAYGLYLINRLLDENPGYRDEFENHLEELLNDATNIIYEIFEPYEVVPFGLDKEWFLEYALKQFQHRMDKLGY